MSTYAFSKPLSKLDLATLVFTSTEAMAIFVSLGLYISSFGYSKPSFRGSISETASREQENQSFLCITTKQTASLSAVQVRVFQLVLYELLPPLIARMKKAFGVLF